MRGEGIGLLITLLVAALPSIARADVAPPRPEDVSCPRGALATVPNVRPDATDPRGRPIRPWPYCAASTCESDADCTGGRVCSAEEIGLCVAPLEVPGGEPVRAARERGCEPDNTCLNMESTCERARRCVLPDAAAEAEAPSESSEGEEPEEAAQVTTESSAGCGCRAAGGGSSWAFALAPIALLARSRRRSRGRARDARAARAPA